MAVAVPSDLKLSIGDIDRKVDMSLGKPKPIRVSLAKMQGGWYLYRLTTKKSPNLQGMALCDGWGLGLSEDDIIKLSKQKNQRRPQVKNPINRRAPFEQKRDALQKTISYRSSAIRQGKLAELRSRNEDFKFAATKAAARRALSTDTAVPIVKRWIRKPLQPVPPRPIRPAAQNFKVSMPSRMNKPVSNRRPVATGSRLPGAAKYRPILQGQPQTVNKVGNGSGWRPQTLDSRFASLREERQLQSQYGPPAQWRR